MVLRVTRLLWITPQTRALSLRGPLTIELVINVSGTPYLAVFHTGSSCCSRSASGFSRYHMLGTERQTPPGMKTRELPLRRDVDDGRQTMTLAIARRGGP